MCTQINEPAEGGFTLLEVVIALIIASLALGVIFPALSDALHRDAENALREHAAILAESTLDQVGTVIPMKDGTLVRTSGKFTWTVRTTPWCPNPTARCEAEPGTVSAHEVSVTVVSTDLPSVMLARLDTVRLLADSP